jgi:phosphonate transport system substrate-binding protein
MSNQSSSQRTPWILLIGLPVMAVVLAAMALYVALVKAPSEQTAKQNQDLVLHMSGLNTAVVNQLDPAFVDSDGDMVANGPAEAKNLIDPPVLVFSYVATEDPTVYRGVFKDLTAHLSKELGREVRYELYNSGNEEVAAMKKGNLHIAGLNTGNVPKAVNVAGFVPLTVLANDSGDRGHKALIIVSTASGISSLSDLRGGDLTVTDTGSNSGFRAPLIMLKDAGLLPERDFQLRFSGGQENSLVGLKEGRYKAVAVASDYLARAVDRNVLSKGSYKVIADMGPFPSASIGVSCLLQPELAAKIRAALFSFKWSNSSLAREFGPSGQTKFESVKYKDDFLLVRRLDTETGQDYSDLAGATGQPAAAEAAVGNVLGANGGVGTTMPSDQPATQP